jgi:hypothetical protein
MIYFLIMINLESFIKLALSTFIKDHRYLFSVVAFPLCAYQSLDWYHERNQ